jgi:hypothetical protein
MHDWPRLPGIPVRRRDCPAPVVARLDKDPRDVGGGAANLL